MKAPPLMPWVGEWSILYYPTLCLIFHSFKISYLTLKNGSYKSIPHSPQKWIPKSHTPLSRNGSQNLIFHSPEIDPEMTKTTYFPLSQHESTLQNIHIQHFWSLGNADTPLFTRGIWKYLFLVAVEFETISHSGFTLVGYIFQIPLLPSKDISIFHSLSVGYLLKLRQGINNQIVD